MNYSFGNNGGGSVIYHLYKVREDNRKGKSFQKRTEKDTHLGT